MAVEDEVNRSVTETHGVSGRVIVVTGAGHGVGRGIAHHLGKGGASIVVAEWKPDRMAATVAELDALGVPSLGIRCDVSRRDDIAALVDATIERFGRVDGLINNAQTFRPNASIAEVTEDDLDVFHDSGAKGTLWGMQAVYPHMAAAGWGRIVNFASSMGIVGGRGFAAYNASKEAIRALTRTAAREWGADGITVNCIAPAAASARGKASAARRSEAYLEFIANCPMGRQGDPEADIAPVALFLCSDGCRYLTGQTLMVDGGAFLWA
ncbi:MAG: SDR family oxidoreductase [Acidimicrobiia bacterium]